MEIYDGPHYYHQFGNGDHKRCVRLLNDGYGVGAILSPKHIMRWPEVMAQVPKDILAAGKQLFIDPQGYNPSHASLDGQQSYINDTSVFLNEAVSISFIEKSLQMQFDLGASEYLIPCPASDMSDTWLSVVPHFSEMARQWAKNTNAPVSLRATIAINASQIRSDNRARLLDMVLSLPVSSIYLVIENVGVFTDDPQLLIGIMEVIFRLRWQGRNVLLGYCGPWTFLTFPFGLNGFANNAHKNTQTFDSGRDDKKQGGGGGKSYFDYWYADGCCYLRYPDEAQLLKKSTRQSLFRNSSPYAPPYDREPDQVKSSKLWTQHQSFDDYSWKMWLLTEEFRNLGREQRIELVRRKLKKAIEKQVELKRELGAETPRYIEAWEYAFETYLTSGSVRKDMNKLYL